MGGFKRLCMGIFALAGLFALGALALTWFGPWTDLASVMLTIDVWSMVVEVCAIILGVGLLVMLLRAIFSRKPRVVEVTSIGGDVITVTLAAIGSQASHIVEADGKCTCKHVYVEAKRRGKVRVRVKVLPRETVDVLAKGEELHAELVTGLTSLCGDKLKEVSLQFLEPENVTVATAEDEPYEETLEEMPTVRYVAPEPMEVPSGVLSDEDESDEPSSEITVSMGGMSARDITSDEEA